jgi:hypothetical protein
MCWGLSEGFTYCVSLVKGGMESCRVVTKRLGNLAVPASQFKQAGRTGHEPNYLIAGMLVEFAPPHPTCCKLRARLGRDLAFLQRPRSCTSSLQEWFGVR